MILRVIYFWGCAGHFGLLLGGKAGLEDPDLQALELDCHLESTGFCWGKLIENWKSKDVEDGQLEEA